MKDILQQQSRLIETLLEGLHSRLDENEKIISWISSAVVENDQKLMRAVVRGPVPRPAGVSDPPHNLYIPHMYQSSID
jgi:hypothetical protein